MLSISQCVKRKLKNFLVSLKTLTGKLHFVFLCGVIFPGSPFHREDQLVRGSDSSKGIRFTFTPYAGTRPFSRETPLKKKLLVTRDKQLSSGQLAPWLSSLWVGVFVSFVVYEYFFSFCIVMPLLLCTSHLKRYLEIFHTVFLVSL